MNKFNIKEYLANPSRKVVTRDGHPARILYTDAKGKYPVVAIFDIDDEEDSVGKFQKDGMYNENEISPFDLFFAPEKKEGFVNLYRTADGDERLGCFRHTEEEARKEASGGNMYKHIATVKLEWEE